MAAELPEPDDWGNYWITRDHTRSAAIFPVKYVAACREVRPTGEYTVYLGVGRGFVEGPVCGVREYFRTVDDAWHALRKHLRRK